MQKTIYLFIIALILSSCKKSDSVQDHRAYIVPTEIHKTGENMSIGIVMQPRYFSTGFWKYFAKQFPGPYSSIFHARTIATYTSGEKLKDFFQLEFDSAQLNALRHELPRGITYVKLFVARDYRRFIQLLDDSINKPVIIFNKDFVKEMDDARN